MPTIARDASMTTGVDSLDDQHRRLISWLDDLLSAMRMGRGPAEIARLLDQLGSYTWLTSHIQRTDTQLAACVGAA
jgi:hemerythrin